MSAPRLEDYPVDFLEVLDYPAEDIFEQKEELCDTYLPSYHLPMQKDVDEHAELLWEKDGDFYTVRTIRVLGIQLCVRNSCLRRRCR